MCNSWHVVSIKYFIQWPLIQFFNLSVQNSFTVPLADSDTMNVKTITNLSHISSVFYIYFTLYKYLKVIFLCSAFCSASQRNLRIFLLILSVIPFSILVVNGLMWYYLCCYRSPQSLMWVEISEIYFTYLKNLFTCLLTHHFTY